MPLEKGKGKDVLGRNIEEFHKGSKYAQTAAKLGKAVADKQAVAVAYAQQRKGKK